MEEQEKKNYLAAITGVKLDNIFTPKIKIEAPGFYRFDIEWINLTDNYIIRKTVKAHEIFEIQKSYPLEYKVLIKEVETGELIADIDVSPKNTACVVFRLASQALGDQLIWIPQLEKWREENNIGKLIINSNWNILYKGQYPSIEFIREEQLESYIRQVPLSYNMGLCLAADRVSGENQSQNIAGRSNWQIHKLDHVMADTLNIEKKAIKPKLNGRGTPKRIDGKYIAITCNGSAMAKNWLYPNGWNELIAYLISLGYKVVHTSNRTAKDMGVTIEHPDFIEAASNNIFDAINLIENADFFVGLSSGNSWLSWALDKKVVMIGGLIDPSYEFHEDRYLAYTPEGKCHGCFTNTNYMWTRSPLWCPLEAKFQGKQMTNRFHNVDNAYECVKTIAPELVKKAVNQVIEDLITNTKRINGLLFRDNLDGSTLVSEIPLEMKEYDGFRDIDIRKEYRRG